MATHAPELDDKALGLIKSVVDANGYGDVRNLIERLDNYLFEQYCAKPYLTVPDVPHCSFAQAGTCGYLNLIRTLNDEHGINLVARTRL